jgi:hypothetical protein
MAVGRLKGVVRVEANYLLEKVPRTLQTPELKPKTPTHKIIKTLEPKP